MQEPRMTIRQLATATKAPIYLQSLQCYRKKDQSSPAVKLTDYLRAYSGIMGLEVFALSNAAQCYIAEVDIPPDVIDALARHGTNPK